MFYEILLESIEARNFKLQYFHRTVRHFYSVKIVDPPATETSISKPHTKMTPDPPPIALTLFRGALVRSYYGGGRILHIPSKLLNYW